MEFLRRSTQRHNIKKMNKPTSKKDTATISAAKEASAEACVAATEAVKKSYAAAKQFEKVAHECTSSVLLDKRLLW